MKSESVIQNLKNAGYSITSARRLVVESLVKANSPINGNQLYQKLKNKIDESTLYRTLQLLKNTDIISTSSFDSNGDYYELKDSDHHHHHHHIQCNSCKKIICLKICELEKSFKQISKKTGFTNISHKLEFFGLCDGCL